VWAGGNPKKITTVEKGKDTKKENQMKRKVKGAAVTCRERDQQGVMPQ